MDIVHKLVETAKREEQKRLSNVLKEKGTLVNGMYYEYSFESHECKPCIAAYFGENPYDVVVDKVRMIAKTKALKLFVHEKIFCDNYGVIEASDAFAGQLQEVVDNIC